MMFSALPKMRHLMIQLDRAPQLASIWTKIKTFEGLNKECNFIYCRNKWQVVVGWETISNQSGFMQP